MVNHSFLVVRLSKKTDCNFLHIKIAFSVCSCYQQQAIFPLSSDLPQGCVPHRLDTGDRPCREYHQLETGDRHRRVPPPDSLSLHGCFHVQNFCHVAAIDPCCCHRSEASECRVGPSAVSAGRPSLAASGLIPLPPQVPMFRCLLFEV